MLLVNTVKKALTPHQGSPWVVALSGGADSVALLHSITVAFPHQSVRALHVHHNLHKEAGEWVDFCRDYCNRLGVDYAVEYVQPKQHTENYAREVRYEAFSKQLSAGDILLVGHHGNDQIETMIFRMVRGTGLKGMAGIRPARPHDESLIVRPLLGVTRAQIEQYCNHHQLEFVVDWTNLTNMFDRNFLRHNIVPVLVDKWPGALASVQSTSQNLIAAQNTLEELLGAQISSHSGQDRWGAWIQPLESLSQQTLWLKFWLERQGFNLGEHKLNSAVELFTSSADNRAVIVLDTQHELRAYAAKIYLVDRSSGTAHYFNQQLDGTNSDYRWYEVFEGSRFRLGDYQLASLRPGGFVQLLNRSGRRKLKVIFQELKVPYWVRDTLPVIYDKDQVVAVADLFIDCNYLAQEDEAGLQCCWLNALK